MPPQSAFLSYLARDYRAAHRCEGSAVDGSSKLMRQRCGRRTARARNVATLDIGEASTARVPPSRPHGSVFAAPSRRLGHRCARFRIALYFSGEARCRDPLR